MGLIVGEMGEVDVSGRSVDHAEFVPAGGTSARRRSISGTIDRAAKRSLDFAFAALILLIVSPLFVACALAVKLESRGPVFYRAHRVGRRGRELQVLKFRKMYEGAEGDALTVDADERFTRIGRFLVRTKLDELPQLWNVLRGQMSLVGPRPEDVSFAMLHRDAYERILSVRPGITGLCQLAFARETEILDPHDRVADYVERILPQKVKLDVLYAETRSLRKDFGILIWTFLPVVVRADVAVNRETGRLTVRRRPRTSKAPSES